SARDEAIIEAEEEAGRMGRLVGDLLLLARADAGETPSFHRERVDLGELATEVVDKARPQAGGRQLAIVSRPQYIVLGDRDRLRQLITNLVENAIRYTPVSGQVEVAVGSSSRVQQRKAAVRSRSARDSGNSTPMALL